MHRGAARYPVGNRECGPPCHPNSIVWNPSAQPTAKICMVELVSWLFEVLFKVQEFDLPLRRLRHWMVGTLALGALVFPTAFRTALIQFSEARACSIESTLSSGFVIGTGRFQVVEHDGWCQLRFVKAEPSAGKHP
jgi:hypothetical protein